MNNVWLLAIIVILIIFMIRCKSREMFYTGPYGGYSGYNYDYDLKHYYTNPKFL